MILFRPQFFDELEIFISRLYTVWSHLFVHLMYNLVRLSQINSGY